ncbi:MAG: SHOCT domain-containing protein [Oscillospiraceae bacterium]|nr:SHOCT domain-containing protein [Oscillospiraceae bacterium]
MGETIVNENVPANEGLLQLDVIIEKAIQIPGVRVNRSAFLAEQFSKTAYSVDGICAQGPIGAGVSRAVLSKMANHLILSRTSASSAASFLAGIPGGIALAATIPADVMQFFGISLRLAQELAYLYGADDLFINGETDSERVRGQLLLYVGVMFGASGAVSGVRLLSNQIAKTTLKKLPQKALTKTFWYPIVKNIGKAIGVKVTKTTVASGISKAIPVVGGVISGSLNFASMYPLAHRLAAALDDAAFDYSEEEFEYDLVTVESAAEQEKQEKSTFKGSAKKESKGLDFLKSGAKFLGEKGLEVAKSSTTLVKDSADKLHNLANAKKASAPQRKSKKQVAQKHNDKMLSLDEQITMVRKLKELVDDGILTQDEFETKKKQILEL